MSEDHSDGFADQPSDREQRVRDYLQSCAPDMLARLLVAAEDERDEVEAATAEAIAQWLEDGGRYMHNRRNIAEAIRNGEWRKP